jgi:hypothetical protein
MVLLPLKGLQILDQVVELILAHVGRDTVGVIVVEDGPDLFERQRLTVMQVGSVLVDAVELRRIEKT